MSDKDKKRLLLFGTGAVLLVILWMLLNSKGQAATATQAGSANPYAFPDLTMPSLDTPNGGVTLNVGGSDFSPWGPPNFNDTVPGFYIGPRDNNPASIPPIGSMPLGGPGCGCCGPAPMTQQRATLTVTSSGNTPAYQYLPGVAGR
jgi:hypothetical protein